MFSAIQHGTKADAELARRIVAMAAARDTDDARTTLYRSEKPGGWGGRSLGCDELRRLYGRQDPPDRPACLPGQ